MYKVSVAVDTQDKSLTLYFTGSMTRLNKLNSLTCKTSWLIWYDTCAKQMNT